MRPWAMDARDYVEDIRRHEGCVLWLYCDVRGFVTVGIGNLVRSPDHAASLPFEHDGEVVATADEKRAAFIAVQDAFRPGLAASAYAHLTTIRMPLDYAVSLLESRLEHEFLPGVARVFHDCESWPLSARRAVVDMAYSLGIDGLVSGYPKFTGACLAQDWAAAADECHRRRKGEVASDPETWGPRNRWTRQMLLEAVALPQPQDFA